MLNAFVDGKYEIPNETNHIQSFSEIEVEQSKPVEHGNSEIETGLIEADLVIRSIRAEAWVESDECTSCNDCTDALPAVFKYNKINKPLCTIQKEDHILR